MSFVDAAESVLQQLIPAVLSGDVSKVREMLDLKVCGVNSSVYANGWTLLHGACYGGNLSLVRTLVRDYKADVNVRDNQDNTPLHVAAQNGREEVVLVLVRVFGCSTEVRGYVGRSVLHDACSGGNVSLVRTLIRAGLVDIDVRDDHNDTSLHLAAFEAKTEVVAVFIQEFGCNVDVQGHVGRSVLHSACEGGDVALVRTLIRRYKASSVNVQDDTGNTPLHLAASVGNEDVAVALVREFSCNLDFKGQAGRSILHSACYSGNVSLVRTLVADFRADTTARDDQNNTPLHLAALEGKEEVVVALIKEFGCSANVGGHVGRSVLHNACESGNVSLVRTLIRDCGADTTARDYQNSTPPHVAAAFGEEEVVVMLIREFGCSTEVKGHSGRTALHGACYRGNVSLAKTLVHDFGADTNACDDRRDTPLHLAVENCSWKIFDALIRECDFGIDARGYMGRSLLHSACASGNTEIVELLSSHISLLAIDDSGNTPLHTCSEKGHISCVEVLLKCAAPVLVRNKSGKSSRDVATPNVKALLNGYIRRNQDKLYLSYDALQDCAKKRYANADPITRLFVIGNPAAGKSSLIATLKIEGFFESFWRVTEDSVPLHTSGIIPSVYKSRNCGRILFYDFAGDPEYYSSHAAILENLNSSKVGNNVFIIVLNLLTDWFRIKNVLGYWISFIRNQKFSNEKRPSLAIMGSHVDKISGEMVQTCKRELHAFCESIQPGLFLQSQYFMLDCCQPRSQQITEIQSYISAIVDNSPRYDLSLQASVLLGLLEKDFSNVTACSIEKILSHIKTSGVLLPDDIPSLLPVLRGLHDIGLLFLVGDSTETNIQVVLQIPQLTKEVHQLLFSKKAKIKFSEEQQLPAPLGLGIIPQDLLDQILPDHITKECLAYLQYCQEISHRDIGVFTSDYMPPDTAPNQSLFFFPALCALSRSDVSWVTPPNLSYSIGWLAKSNDPSDYFSSRFLHVLLLRLVFKFTLSAPNPTQISSASPLAINSSHFNRRCTMWKTGVRWLMEEGVECMVELVSLQSREQGVVVITRSYGEVVDSCLRIFNGIVMCVMEAKAEFCRSMKPDLFLLDSTEASSHLNEDNLFAMSDVERVLTSLEGKEAVVSITGMKMMKREEIVCLRKFTHWDQFFPLDFAAVLRQLQEVVSAGEICRLSLNLDLPTSAFRVIDSLADTDEMKMELVKCWLQSSRDPPCWWQLVRALRVIDYNVLAAEIERKYGK